MGRVGIDVGFFVLGWVFIVVDEVICFYVIVLMVVVLCFGCGLMWVFIV